MSNAKKIALSAAIILSTAFSALTAANAGFSREQAVSQGGTGSRPIVMTAASSRVTGARTSSDKAAQSAALFVSGVTLPISSTQPMRGKRQAKSDGIRHRDQRL